MLVDRRALLVATAAGGAVAALAPRSFARSPTGLFASRGLSIGLQLYTLGDEARTDLAGTFRQIAEIGYRDIELPELYGRAPADIRAMADHAGLRLTSVHLALSEDAPPALLTLGSAPGRIATELNLLGIRHAVLPSLPLPRLYPRQTGEPYQAYRMRALLAAGADHWKRVAEQLNEIGTALQNEGLSLGYHNHGFEFISIGETTGWDILVHETDPTKVHFEIDVGWVAAAGIEPISFLQNHSGRINQLHVKDIKVANKKDRPSTIDTTEVGFGSLDWPSILLTAYQAGARHFYVEQEAPFIIPRMESAAKSFTFLNNLK